jgi:hypothetical protein
LGIIQMNMKGTGQKVDTVARLEDAGKQPTVNTGTVSGGQTQREINRKMASITGKFPDLFTGLGRAKVEPVHIEVDPKVKPIQQKRRTIALHYVDRLKKHLVELKKEGVISGPLGSEWARGWICNPVITGKKWDKDKIRVNLDTRTMKEAVKTSKFPIPTETCISRQRSLFDIGYEPCVSSVCYDRGEQEAVRVLHTLGPVLFQHPGDGDSSSQQ